MNRLDGELMTPKPCILTQYAFLLALLILAAPAAFALEADELLLITNSKAPAGQKLAELYASKRGVPAGRIFSLDLPFPQEQMSGEMYDQQVVPKVRSFLRDNGLEEKVKCIVTFWGVPLRVQDRPNTPDQNQEIAERTRDIGRAEQQINQAVLALEAAAQSLDLEFSPKQGPRLDAMAARAEAAAAAVRARLPSADEALRDDAYRQLIQTVRLLVGKARSIQEASRPELARLYPQSLTQEDIQTIQREIQAAQQELARLKQGLTERKNRDRAAAIIRKHFGLLQYVQAMHGLRQAIDGRETQAAFDSELSLLWLDGYPKQRWMPNFLHHAQATKRPAGARVLMVSRIDGPTEAIARRIIEDSIAVEKKGLTGIVALDARGKRGNDGYGQYDNTIRQLAALLKAKTTLDIRFDDAEPLLKPESLKGVALYCGWYSLRNYVPGAQFNKGAVGFHIASHELVSLRGVGEKGWVANLLKDGVSASLGPVAEPYLHSFPRADEFFPLLLTGKLTLAEVYWRTSPMASWMNACIGDPLYTPYKKNPPLAAAGLPPALRGAVEPEAAPASTTPQ